MPLATVLVLLPATQAPAQTTTTRTQTPAYARTATRAQTPARGTVTIRTTRTTRTTTDASWRQDGGDPGRSGHQPVTGTLDPAAARHLDRSWTAPATRADEQIGGAVVVDGTLFRSPGGPTGQVRRYDAVTGGDRGPIVDVPGRRLGQLAVVRGGAGADLLLVESSDVGAAGRHLSAYRTDGTTIWEIALADEVTGGYTVGDGVVLRSSGATLRAYRSADGATAWTAPLGGEPGFHPPVVAGGLVLQATEGSELLAFDAGTGVPAWRRAVSGAEIIAAAGAVYAVGEAGVCSYAAVDGGERWCAAGDAGSSPLHATVSGEALFVIDGAGQLAAFGTANGAPLWRTGYGLHAEVDTSYWSPVNGGGVVYAVAYHFDVQGGGPRHRTELIAADARTGALLSRVDLNFDALHGGEPLLLSGDHVYFAALQTLFALAAGDY